VHKSSLCRQPISATRIYDTVADAIRLWLQVAIVDYFFDRKLALHDCQET
jgi:hypothetical protein